jgi:signal transduction histidine kinase
MRWHWPGSGRRTAWRWRSVTCIAGDEVQIEVADNGCGIPPAVMERIFDPFFTTKPQGEGTGLGLSISFGIIQEHGGQIEVQSQPDQGSRFILHLPIDRKRTKSG